MTGSTITLENALHLKSGVSYLERNYLLATGEFLSKSEFQHFNIIEINNDESYAANCVLINSRDVQDVELCIEMRHLLMLWSLRLIVHI